MFFGATNQFNVATGGVERLKIDSTAVIFNETGASVDFRVEGDLDSHLIFADASADRLGVGESSPDNKLHVNCGSDNIAALFESTDAEVQIRLKDTGSTIAALAATNGSFAFENTSTSLVKILSDGRTGFGTTSPQAVVHIVAGGNNLRLGRSSFDDLQFGIGTVSSINGLHLSNITDSNTSISIDEGAGDNAIRIRSGGNIELGTADGTTIGSPDQNVVIGATGDGEEAALTVNVMEGTNNRRIKLFLDDTEGVYGFDGTASTGVAPFVIRFSTTEKFRLNIDGSASLVGSLTQNTSDIRFKKNINVITDALTKIKKLKGFTYNWNDLSFEKLFGDTEEMRASYSALEVGVSAQDVQEVQPEAVKPCNNKDYLTVQYEKLVPLLIEAVKELSTKVAALEAA